MGAITRIAWCDATFNPWVGCLRVSTACDRCYAAALSWRYGWRDGKGRDLWDVRADRKRTSSVYWRGPLRWNERAQAEGTRRRVFCASMADVFDNKVPTSWRVDLWSLIRSTPALDWFLLTKRPQNIREMLPTDWSGGWPHVWLGTTTENQEEAHRRIPHLVAIPAAARFLSVEPMLEPVDVAPWLVLPSHDRRTLISWIIVGGEAGGGARPMHPDWLRGLRDQVHAAGRQALREADRQQSRALAKCHRQRRRPGTMAGRFAGAGLPAMKSDARPVVPQGNPLRSHSQE
jgi:protein gp37